MDDEQKYELIREIRSIEYLTFEQYELIRKLGKLIKKHRNLCTKYCNEDVPNFDFKINKLETRISELKDLNPSLNAFGVRFQHDPRGQTVIIDNSLNSLYWIFHY